MQAKAITPYPITAFSGREYVPYEWRPVPAGCEDEARRNPYLTLQETAELDAVVGQITTAVELSAFTRRELQDMAKEAGIPANQTTVALVEALSSLETVDEEEE